METSKTVVADALREKELCPPSVSHRAISESMSLPSYKQYPVHRPFVNTVVHQTPQACTRQSSRPSSPSKAFPETSSAAIFSALRNLQEKIRELELEKEQAKLSLRMMGKDTSHTHPRSEKDLQRFVNSQTDTKRESGDQSNNYNQALITHLAAAETRCVKLERQLDHMKRMLRHAKADTTNLRQQVSKSSDLVLDNLSGPAQSEKLKRLEQEYRRLTRTQNNAEMKILELEMKLQEEEHQRKLVQDKANQLQTGLEANRILLQSVSPHMSRKPAKGKKFTSKPSSHTEPHYRLDLRDAPFVAGMSAGCSHSVRANVQAVLSLMKQHQPQLCNKRVLSQNPSSAQAASDSDSSSASSSTSEEELSELLHALQEELRLMSLEQDELMRQVDSSVSVRERKDIQREQERLLLKMEKKGEQINKLHKHKSKLKKLRKEASLRHGNRTDARVPATMTTRGRSGAVKLHPGETSKKNLRLLRDMKALQSSLRT